MQELRVLGAPANEHPAKGVVRINYPIVREGLVLHDLRITQVYSLETNMSQGDCDQPPRLPR